MKIHLLNKKSNTIAVSIPRSIATAYNWQPGDEIKFRIDKTGTITFYKVEQ